MSSNIVLILGAGPNTGLATTKHFSQKGYKTIIVSRNPSDELSKAADLSISADFSDPTTIKSVFEEVKSKIGIPNVVIYNPYMGILKLDPFSVPVEEWITGMNINFISVYAAIQEAIKEFRQLPASTLKTITFTGNLSIHKAIPLVMHLGVSKCAAAHMVECGSIKYLEEGFRFYFVDERLEDGSSPFQGLNGQAHAEEFYSLATRTDQGPWEYTFVAGNGYVDFKGEIGTLPDFKGLEEQVAAAEAGGK